MTPTRRSGTFNKGTGPEGRGSRVEAWGVAEGGLEEAGAVKWESGTVGAGEVDFWFWRNPIGNGVCCAEGFDNSRAGVNAGGKYGRADCAEGVLGSEGSGSNSLCPAAEV